jgi:ribosomal protein S18 acetylase RimI-like enzyme
MFFHGLTDYEIAKQVANLINVNNQLSFKRRSVDVIQSRINYVVETHGKLVIAAVGIDRQSFTFSEIKHLVVRPEWRRKGVGRFVAKRAIELVETPLMYCTVRADNPASVQLFEGLGFTTADQYEADNHEVILLTRASPRREKKCKNPTWKPISWENEISIPEGPVSEPSSWGAMMPSSPEEDV